MKVRKIPMRTCVITREKCEKKDLIRVVRTPVGNVIVDISGKANGRGAYLKKDINVIDKAEKNKVLNGILGVNVEKEIYDELRNIIEMTSA
ncbi:MAG: YlxR family protein [Bacilli bacterium]|nr:YlxR family protein [Bacilli bacterium]